FLSVDGEFFRFGDEDHPGEFLPENDEQWQIATLATASRRDAELASLLPERPLKAADCSSCDGRGYVMLGEKPSDVTCAVWAGLASRFGETKHGIVAVPPA